MLAGCIVSQKLLTRGEIGEEVVVRVASHAMGEDVAAEAELQRDAGCSQAHLQAFIQVAHVAHPVRLHIQHFSRLLWVEDLQGCDISS
jgi:hypothetical protein